MLAQPVNSAEPGTLMTGKLTISHRLIYVCFIGVFFSRHSRNVKPQIDSALLFFIDFMTA